MESFDSTKKSLYEILKDVHSGKIQLPDFQRNWVWDDNRIRGIIASVAKSFPIGAVMLLETGNDAVRFKAKPVEGVKNINGLAPDLLILDGQQRITSLYQAIVTNDVVTTHNDKGYEIKRWYYIDMQKAMDDTYDLEEAIISINERKIQTTNIGRDIILDLSIPENEYRYMYYPVCMIDEYSAWRKEFNKFWNYDPAKLQFWDLFEEKVINSFNRYMLPVIVLKKENPKEAVCQVFEKVNTGGVALNVFELLTATYAIDEFDLKKNWLDIRVQFQKYRLLANVSNTDIIQSVTLLSTYYHKMAKTAEGVKAENLPAVGCKRKDMLNLSVHEYRKYRDAVVRGFIKAAKILQEHHIYTARDLPYNTQLIPMAAILAVLGDKADSAGSRNKLMQWYWCGIFGELYGSANETRYALDLPQMAAYIENPNEIPKTIAEANFVPARLHTLRTRNSAAYKGVYALLMHDDTRDWITATRIDFSTYMQDYIDIHHIFPVAWCERNGISPYIYNSIINKTPLSGRTNRIVSGDAPSRYLERVKRHVGVSDAEFETILRSHILDPRLLYADDFKAFFENRKEQILARIEKAMGKQIIRETTSPDEESVENGNGFETQVDETEIEQ